MKPAFWVRPSILVAAASLLAAFLRFYRLSSLAPEAWFDEVWFALRAREMLQHPMFTVFYHTDWGGGNALMVYLTAIVQGLGFTGIASSRVASAALGLAAVPLGYACFDELLRSEPWQAPRRRWTAALAAFILSSLLHWVIVSRVGTEPSLAPAAALFCVWQLKRGKRTAGAGQVFNLSYIAAGLVAGLAQYNGPHARFVLPLLAFVALHDLPGCPASERKSLVAHYLIAALAAVLVALPLIAFFIREPEWLFARARLTASSALDDLDYARTNLYFLVISFNFVGSFDPLTNYPGLPMFDLVQSMGFAVGHGWVVWNLRRSAAARELLAWEMLMALPSLLTTDAPNFQRMIGFGAPAAAVIAIGWMATMIFFARTAFAPRVEGDRQGAGTGRGLPGRPGRQQAADAPRRPPARIVGLLLLGFGIFVLSPLYQSYTLLVRYPALSILPVSYLNAPVRVARELIARAVEGERVFVSRSPEADDVIAFEFLFPGTPVERMDFRQCLPLADGRRTGTHYLVLTRRDKVTMPNLYAAYPSSKITADYYWQDSGTRVEVAPGSPGPRPPHPGRAAFDPGLTFVGYEWSGQEVAAGQSLLMTLWWKVEADLRADYTSFVHVGTGLDGTGIIAQRDGQPCQGLFTTSHWRAGDLVRDSFAISLPPEAPAGKYPLAVGWYTYPDFARLPLLSADSALPDNRAIIATIEVSR